MVDLTNLQRQVLHGTVKSGRPKLDPRPCPAARPQSPCPVEPFADRLTSANALEILRAFDLVLDGSDNFPTRYLVNDACVLLRQAAGLRQHLPLRGPGLGVRRRARALLPLPLQRAAAAGPGPELCRGRRAWRAARCHRQPAGARGHQADPGRRASRSSAGCCSSMRCGCTSGNCSFARTPTARSAGRSGRITGLIDYEAFCGIGAPATHAGPEITARELRRDARAGTPGHRDPRCARAA